jgi:hypothetical protein
MIGNVLSLSGEPWVTMWRFGDNELPGVVPFGLTRSPPNIGEAEWTG